MLPLPPERLKEVEGIIRQMGWRLAPDKPRSVYQSYEGTFALTTVKADADGKPKTHVVDFWIAIVSALTMREHTGGITKISEGKLYRIPQDLCEVACGLAWRQLKKR